MSKMPPPILFVGNFLSTTRKHRHYCEDLTDRLELRGWNVLRTSAQPGRVRRLADMMKVTLAARNDYRLAHLDVFSGPAFLWCEAVAVELIALRKPFVLTLRGGRLPEFAKRWPGRVRRLFERAARVIAPSSYLRDALGPLAREIEIVPNAIDLEAYPRRQPQPLRRLIWVRAFHSTYNPVLAVEVLARVRERQPSLELTMVGADTGDGTLQATQARVRELQLDHIVKIVPGVPKQDVPTYLLTGDVFLNTANIDNTPVSVIEAMAAGACVVSTNVGGVPHLLRDGADSLLVPPADPAAMASAIVRLIDDDALAKRLSQHARSRAESFDWKPVLRMWEQIFTGIVHGA